jgi:hypothetical protein
MKYALLHLSLAGLQSSFPFQKAFTALATVARARANSSRLWSKSDGLSRVLIISSARLSTAAANGGAESSRSSSRVSGARDDVRDRSAM